MANRTSNPPRSRLLFLTSLLSTVLTAASAAIAVRPNAEVHEYIYDSQSDRHVVTHPPTWRLPRRGEEAVGGSEKPEESRFRELNKKYHCISEAPNHDCRFLKCDNTSDIIHLNGRIVEHVDRKRGEKKDGEYMTVHGQAVNGTSKNTPRNHHPSVEKADFAGIPPVLGDAFTTQNPCLVRTTTILDGHTVWAKQAGNCNLIKIHPLPSSPVIDQIAMGYPRRWVLGNTMWGLFAKDHVTSNCVLVAVNEIAPCEGFDFSILDGEAPDTQPQPEAPTYLIALKDSATDMMVHILESLFGHESKQKTDKSEEKQKRDHATNQTYSEGYTEVTPYGILMNYGNGTCRIDNSPPMPCQDVLSYAASHTSSSTIPPFVHPTFAGSSNMTTAVSYSATTTVMIVTATPSTISVSNSGTTMTTSVQPSSVPPYPASNTTSTDGPAPTSSSNDTLIYSADGMCSLGKDGDRFPCVEGDWDSPPYGNHTNGTYVIDPILQPPPPPARKITYNGDGTFSIDDGEARYECKKKEEGLCEIELAVRVLN